MDELTQLICELRLHSSIFYRSDLASPWGIAFDASSELRFHALLRGECWVGHDRMGEPLQLREMEVVLMMSGVNHWVADQPGRSLVAGQAVLESCDLGRPLFQEGPTDETLLCGRAAFADNDVALALLNLVSPSVRIRHGDDGGSQVWRLVESIDEEVLGEAPGHKVIVDRLTEALFVSLLRRAVEPMVAASGVARALRDPRLPKALRRIHERPQEKWTIAVLAEHAGMSRAAFARRFKSTLAMTPMAYVTGIRIAKAKRMLASGDSVDRVASAVGYESPEAFRKLFQRTTGKSPVAYARARP